MVSFTPFILVLGAFVSFVYWNGSVVLGTALLFCCCVFAITSNFQLLSSSCLCVLALCLYFYFSVCMLYPPFFVLQVLRKPMLYPLILLKLCILLWFLHYLVLRSISLWAMLLLCCDHFSRLGHLVFSWDLSSSLLVYFLCTSSGKQRKPNCTCLCSYGLDFFDICMLSCIQTEVFPVALKEISEHGIYGNINTHLDTFQFLVHCRSIKSNIKHSTFTYQSNYL